MIRFIRKRDNVTTFIIINTDHISSVDCAAPALLEGKPKLYLWMITEQHPYVFLGNEAYQVLDALKPYLDKTVEFNE